MDLCSVVAVFRDNVGDNCICISIKCSGSLERSIEWPFSWTSSGVDRVHDSMPNDHATTDV